MAQSVKVCGVDVDREEKVSGVEKCVVMRHRPWRQSLVLVKPLTGTWKTALKYTRFNLVDGYLLRYAGYDFDNSPMIEQRGERGAKFGNCAETYPFLDIFNVRFMFFPMPCPLLISA
jgi:hypothetical protein